MGDGVVEAVSELSFKALRDLESEAKSHRTSQLLQEEEIAFEDLQGLDAEDNLLGKGCFGEVRQVYWRKTPAAAKIAHSNMPEVDKLLVLRELQLMARCRHPNIVQFLGFTDKPFVIVMELVTQGDLKHYWRTRKVSVGHKVSICIEVLRALGYLHNRKPSSIIHRDIKPSNVLITTSGVAKLTDFGLGRIMAQSDSKHSGDFFVPSSQSSRNSKADEQKQTSNGEAPKCVPTKVTTIMPHGDVTSVVGTAPYAAPESNLSNYDEKVDIYSAGVTFYELFEQMAFDDAMPFAFALAPSKVMPLLKQMGSIKPTERPSALEMVDAFEATKLARSPRPLNTSCGCVLS
mmetsp:Transcript_36744/g.97091  ORF Transcript_36744/g.97091 Transcript_36744/m.97091 type:complete len:346 (+) Transcript_36744:82-1119(+)